MSHRRYFCDAHRNNSDSGTKRICINSPWQQRFCQEPCLAFQEWPRLKLTRIRNSKVLQYWPIASTNANDSNCLDISGRYACYGNDVPGSYAKFRIPTILFTMRMVWDYLAPPEIDKKISYVDVKQNGNLVDVTFYSDRNIKLHSTILHFACERDRLIYKKSVEANGTGFHGTVEEVTTIYRASDGSLLAQVNLQTIYDGFWSIFASNPPKEEWWARFAPWLNEKQ
jgi:hypothetical protein